MPRPGSAVCVREPSIGLEITALTGATFHDRWQVAAHLARRSGRATRVLLAAPGRAAARFATPAPERLLIAPQDIRTSDPTIAADIGADYFAFGGKIVNAMGRSPFLLEAGSDDWTRQLAGFGWLRHLRAADSATVRARGRGLVEDFLAVHAKPSSHPAWEPRVTARRALSWLSQSPVVLDGADRDFYNRFLAAVVRHRVQLERQLSDSLADGDRLIVAIALAAVGLCCEGSAALQRRGTDALAAAIEAQLLPDGGHISRNPQVLIDLLLDLLPLRQAYAARGLQAPDAMLNAIDRMIPMLRLFRHGDGTLALFNGMGQTAPELVATILSYDDARAQPLTNARQSGYQRVQGGQTLLVVESGPPPPRLFSTRAHAGCLSFELSSGPQRIVINCGTFDGGRPVAREPARTTAAHSTLVIDDVSSCRFATNAGLTRWLGEQVLSGPSEVPVERVTAADNETLTLSHDGYAQRFGCIHRRTLSLAADGSRLTGTDALAAVAGRSFADIAYALRFHLHPAVKARASADGSAVRLDLPSGETWQFTAEADIFVEPSILFAAAGGPRPTMQLRVAARTGERVEIGWQLRRIATDSERR